VEHVQKNNKVIVIVRDTGEGIGSDILPRLFSKFATKSYQGTGLGLFISKGIIEAHGGKIWAEYSAVLFRCRLRYNRLILLSMTHSILRMRSDIIFNNIDQQALQ